jgi:hypothetical protein
MHYRTRMVNARKRTLSVAPDLLEEFGGFYRSPELPKEFRERLAGFTRQFSAPEEVTVARYMVDYLLEEERIPSAREVKTATGIRLAVKQMGPLVTYLVGRLRSTFAEDWQLQRFGVSVALCGVRLRIEILVISRL